MTMFLGYFERSVSEKVTDQKLPKGNFIRCVFVQAKLVLLSAIADKPSAEPVQNEILV